jgi:hypothetical protein
MLRRSISVVSTVRTGLCPSSPKLNAQPTSPIVRAAGSCEKPLRPSSLPILVSFLQDIELGRRRCDENLQKRIKKFEGAYLMMDRLDRHASLKYIASLSTSVEVSQAAINHFSKSPASPLALHRLREDISPKYEHLFLTIAKESGLPLLLHLRADLCELMELKNSVEEEALSAMDICLRSLLSSWFSVGFLELRRITYEGTGGGILEKIARYETVHKVEYPSVHSLMFV